MMPSQLQPTRYLIREKHLSLDNKFIITDGSGIIHYKCNSIFFTIGDKILIFDANDNILIKIRQDNLHIHLTYKIYSIRSDGTEYQIALIKRTGPLWEHKLEINSNNGDYILQKNNSISSNEFILIKNNNTVAIITRDASPTKILYWVDIIDNTEEDHAFILAIIIVFSCTQRLPGNPIRIHHVNESNV